MRQELCIKTRYRYVNAFPEHFQPLLAECQGFFKGLFKKNKTKIDEPILSSSKFLITLKRVRQEFCIITRYRCVNAFPEHFQPLLAECQGFINKTIINCLQFIQMDPTKENFAHIYNRDYGRLKHTLRFSKNLRGLRSKVELIKTMWRISLRSRKNPPQIEWVPQLY